MSPAATSASTKACPVIATTARVPSESGAKTSTRPSAMGNRPAAACSKIAANGWAGSTVSRYAAGSWQNAASVADLPPLAWTP